MLAWSLIGEIPPGALLFICPLCKMAWFFIVFDCWQTYIVSSVGFYQMAKIAVTPAIVLAEFIVFRKKISFQKVTGCQVPGVPKKIT